MKKNKTLDLTSEAWKSNPKWVHVGHKINKIPLTKTQKVVRVIAVANFVAPGTVGPVTSPLIIAAGNKLSRKLNKNSMVKLR